MQLIPVTNDASQKFVTFLNKQPVEIKIWYQNVGSGWYIDIAYENKKIVSARRLNNKARLIRNIIKDFEGELVVVPSTAPEQELGRRAWGNTHKMVYLTNEELKGALNASL